MKKIFGSKVVEFIKLLLINISGIKKKVVIITRETKGGVLTYVNNYFSYLLQTNTEITYELITYLDNPRYYSRIERESAKSKIYFSEYSTKQQKASVLKPLLEEVSLVICNDTLELSLLNILNTQAKVIFILHGEILHYVNALQKYSTIIDDVWCVSLGLKDRFVKEYNNFSFNIVYPIVEEFEFRVKKKERPLQIGFVGRFTYIKGADEVLEVMLSKLNEDLNWTLIIPTSENSSFKFPFSQFDNIEIFQNLDNAEVIQKLHSIDVLFFPSRSEGMPVSVLECLKLGIPCISRDLPIGINEMIIHNKNGFICNHTNDFLLNIQKILDMNDLEWEVYQKSAFELSHNKFNNIELVIKFIDSLSSALHSNFRKKIFFSENEFSKFQGFLVRIYRFFKYGKYKKK